ncbi:hypothetical protein [Oceanibacterium hippocampi]|uniref:Lipoprotein n=1 Tax=Oceanibacterium hippocampi TaxID=745714 RepID=A0A1Y5TCI5_9PROT|nr:hypothetical protein [Oceanibacterium hippocampi]SLN57360.1 hypothetical protein OCH7691_02506 [Oceanibacterium hippocampi]
MNKIIRLALPALLLPVLVACSATRQTEPTAMLRDHCVIQGFGPEGSVNWEYCLRTYSIAGNGVELDAARVGLGQP